MTDAWHCRWCGKPKGVPSLVEDHKAICPMRPNSAPEETR